MWFVRPGDANETAAAWRLAIDRRDGPVALSLTRQKLPTLAETAGLAREGVARGGYVLRESSGGPSRIDVLLLATGSELGLIAAAAERLEADGVATRVVSMPCWEAFDRQSQGYRDEVLPPAVRRRLSVEAGVGLGWERWVGDEGAIMSIEHFGASAPGATIFEHYGFTVDHVTEVARGVADGLLRGRQPTLDPGHQPAGLGLGHSYGEDGSRGS
jgi:transketolase